MRACPQCQNEVKDAKHLFCTFCGFALRQPCPHCSSQLETPNEPFTTCQHCNHDFWSCRSCGRLYHLDRTSCQNSFCPSEAKFWTTRFGQDTFHQQELERVLPELSFQNETPSPAWVGGATAASDIRWPHLHNMGLILSVQESGVVELWAEHGAPHQTEGSDFKETSVCLIRLDLGEEAVSPPFHWGEHYLMPGETSLSALEFHASPSVAHRTDISTIGEPRHFQPLGTGILVWGTESSGFYRGPKEFEVLELPRLQPGTQLSNGRELLQVQSDSKNSLLIKPDFSFVEMGETGLQQTVEYAVWADRFILFSGKTMAYLEDEEFVCQELPASIVSQPLYLEQENRLLLLLNDGSIRTCSTTGEKFSFRCEMAGMPTTWPLLLGSKVFYGTEGRYLCCDEEAIRPRLSSPPMGKLSYANNRIFGSSRDGSMFCFEL